MEHLMARAYHQFSEAYVAEEAAAEVGGRGLWRGQFVAPWAWRRGVRLDERTLENPRAGSVQSGIGVISGWACEAEQIEIASTHGETGAVSLWTGGLPDESGRYAGRV